MAFDPFRLSKSPQALFNQFSGVTNPSMFYLHIYFLNYHIGCPIDNKHATTVLRLLLDGWPVGRPAMWWRLETTMRNNQLKCMQCPIQRLSCDIIALLRINLHVCETWVLWCSSHNSSFTQLSAFNNRLTLARSHTQVKSVNPQRVW